MTWVWFPQGAETLYLPLAILHGTEPVSTLTCALLYCCSLYIFLSFLDFKFHQWRSRADKVVNLIIIFRLNTTIRLPLFWTWTWALASTLAWRMGVIVAVVEPRSKSDKRWLAGNLAHAFPWIVKNTWKQGPIVRVFQPSTSLGPQNEPWKGRKMQLDRCNHHFFNDHEKFWF